MEHFVRRDNSAHLIRNHAHVLLIADSLIAVRAATRLAKKSCLDQLMLLCRLLLLLNLLVLSHLRDTVTRILALLYKVCLQVRSFFVLTNLPPLLLHAMVLLFLQMRCWAVWRHILYVLLILLLVENRGSHHFAHHFFHALAMLRHGFRLALWLSGVASFFARCRVILHNSLLILCCYWIGVCRQCMNDLWL